MEYQVTRPSFVRTNWTQVFITFAACFAACLLATGAVYALIYFFNKKQEKYHGNIPAQTKQQRPIREKEEISEQVQSPQSLDQQEENHQAQADEGEEKADQKTDEKKPIAKTVQLKKGKMP